ncbi:MAG TPA: FHA domain-containing protein [Myxococcales bacterium]|nr:FHA domain-containing protein [Myxococcales bacterium]
MFFELVDRVLPFLKRDKQQGKVCPNGHVMHPSWDVCPYCLEMQQAMGLQGGAGSVPLPSATQGTAMVSLSDLGKSAKDAKKGEVCGWLVALNGQHKGEDFRLRVGKNVLGTAADCDVVLTDKKISRKHATIRYEGGEFQIADLDSSNGTFVNEEKVQKHDLIDNDIVKLGDIEFEFKCRAIREKRE